MPEVPWELIASRLGRYLQLSYVTAVVAGATILLAIWVDSLDGSPEHRRSQMTEQTTNLTSHRGVLFVVILALAAVVACYLVGIVVRYLTWWAANKLRLVTMAVMGLTGISRAIHEARRRFFAKAELRSKRHSRRGEVVRELFVEQPPDQAVVDVDFVGVQLWGHRLGR
jgi:hypothetical protein